MCGRLGESRKLGWRAESREESERRRAPLEAWAFARIQNACLGVGGSACSRKHINPTPSGNVTGLVRVRLKDSSLSKRCGRGKHEDDYNTEI
ncbi:hypothetical protein GOBAR_DD17507 [Gossypium barbadense]|nr:hypothetical protein GOBAR_DD17507 [Gossypium barbadense]